MPVFWLNEDPEDFPPADWSEPGGLLALGGDLEPRRLLAAYRRGIFPWYSEGQPILWHCPDPRFSLVPAELHVPKSLQKSMRRGEYEVRLDTSFEEVIAGCAQAPRPGQQGTWLTQEMQDAYAKLHHLGFAHSAESYQGGELVGGLYGVSLGSVFFGESMFTRAPDASKVAFATLISQLVRWDFTLVDCQMETSHLARFGAKPVSRKSFLAQLKKGLKAETRLGPWAMERQAPRSH